MTARLNLGSNGDSASSNGFRSAVHLPSSSAHDSHHHHRLAAAAASASAVNLRTASSPLATAGDAHSDPSLSPGMSPVSELRSSSSNLVSNSSPVVAGSGLTSTPKDLRTTTLPPPPAPLPSFAPSSSQGMTRYAGVSNVNSLAVQRSNFGNNGFRPAKREEESDKLK